MSLDGGSRGGRGGRKVAGVPGTGSEKTKMTSAPGGGEGKYERGKRI